MFQNYQLHLNCNFISKVQKSNRNTSKKKRFWYVQAFIFHYIVCQTILSINQCARGLFIFKARRLLEKNYFKLDFLFPKEKLFTLIFQVGSGISIILPIYPHRKIVPWVKKEKLWVAASLPKVYSFHNHQGQQHTFQCRQSLGLSFPELHILLSD